MMFRIVMVIMYFGAIVDRLLKTAEVKDAGTPDFRVVQKKYLTLAS